MVYRYIYKNKKTGKKVYSDRIIKDDDLELIREIKGGPIKQDKIIKK